MRGRAWRKLSPREPFAMLALKARSPWTRAAPSESLTTTTVTVEGSPRQKPQRSVRRRDRSSDRKLLPQRRSRLRRCRTAREMASAETLPRAGNHRFVCSRAWHIRSDPRSELSASIQSLLESTSGGSQSEISSFALKGQATPNSEGKL